LPSSAAMRVRAARNCSTAARSSSYDDIAVQPCVKGCLRISGSWRKK
jgi:hypothetical protein